MKSRFTAAKLGIAFALALGAAVPASAIATPAFADGYHDMHRGFDHRGDHRDNRANYDGWHSERDHFRHRHDHGFWFGR
jgi:hypothetical protein